MKLEKFNYSNGKRSRWFLYGVICTVLLMVLINLFFSQAKYFNTESIKIVEGTIKNYSPYDFKLLAVKVENENGEYESNDTIPESGYTFNKTESYCTIPDGRGETTTDTSVLMEYKDGKVYIGVTKKGTKCYLCFDIQPPAKDIILANKTINTRTDFSTTLTSDTTGTIYSAEDDYGIGYYYAGAPTDNWVKFAGFYWRIIRINGDGTIRMIYQGTATNTTGTGTQIGTCLFNSKWDDNMYVGYMYTSGQVHGNTIASTIKEVLDTWYTNNLLGYASYIATGNGATFCNDRQPSTSTSSLNGSGGTGTIETYYAGLIRLGNSKAPTLKCVDSGDRFDTSIGLVTADEVSYAGGVYGTSNSSYYLYTNQNYWTITPEGFAPSGAYGYLNSRKMIIRENGNIASFGGGSNAGARPVINLRADVTLTGNGTSTDPYVVS